jgi:hypothetical protein
VRIVFGVGRFGGTGNAEGSRNGSDVNRWKQRISSFLPAPDCLESSAVPTSRKNQTSRLDIVLTATAGTPRIAIHNRWTT